MTYRKQSPGLLKDKGIIILAICLCVSLIANFVTLRKVQAETEIVKDLALQVQDATEMAANASSQAQIAMEMTTEMQADVAAATETAANVLTQVQVAVKTANEAQEEAKAATEKVSEALTKAKSTTQAKPQAKQVSSSSTSSGSVLTRSGGVNYFNGHKETWYSERVLPGGGLNIPGRHTDEAGLVRDGDGYICVASSDYSKGTVVETSLGTGKVYDSGCASGVIDIYTNW